MKNGDISNVTAPYIFIDIDGLLFKEERERFKKIFGIKIPLPPKKIINPYLKSLLERIERNYDLNVVLFSHNYKEDDRGYLEDLLEKERIPYRQICFYGDVYSLRNERYLYLFSGNHNLVSFISRKEALHISEIGEVLHV